MDTFKKIVGKIDDFAAYGSCFLIFVNMAVVTISVILRMAFGKPISGLTDIVGFISAGAAALSFGYTEKEHGFMQVDFVKEYLPKSVQHVLHILLGILSIGVLGLVTYRFVVYGITCYNLGTVSWVVFLPYWPICILLVIGCGIYTLTTIYHFILEIEKWKEEAK